MKHEWNVSSCLKIGEIVDKSPSREGRKSMKSSWRLQKVQKPLTLFLSFFLDSF